MALTDVWIWDYERLRWERKFLDTDTLPQGATCNERGWCWAAMNRPPSPSLTPGWSPTADWNPSAAGTPLRREPKPQPQKPRTDYAWLAGRIEQQSIELYNGECWRREWSLKRTRRLREEMTDLLARINARSARITVAQYAIERASDHDFIESMFSLYSTGRTRLL
jgi:hypothetical protein